MALPQRARRVGRGCPSSAGQPSTPRPVSPGPAGGERGLLAEGQTQVTLSRGAFLGQTELASGRGALWEGEAAEGRAVPLALSPPLGAGA